MRYLCGVTASVLAVGFVFAGGATQEQYEKLLSEAVKQINATADVLASVKDKASAEAAKAKLKDIGGKLKSIQTEGDKLGKPDPKIEGELKGKYKDKLESAAKRIIAESIRVATVEGGKELLMDLQSVFPKMGGGPGKKKSSDESK